MALGYCMTCGQLVSIRQGPQKWGSRECAWYPISHWRQREADGLPERCAGDKKEIK